MATMQDFSKNHLSGDTPKRKPGRPAAIKINPVVEPPVEKVNTGIKDTPLVDEKPEQEAKDAPIRTCPNHPNAKATTYGLCIKCFNKLSKMEKRKLYLNARLHGSNTHNYPMELRRAWRREVSLIEAGLWKRPMKTKAKTKLSEVLMD